MDSAQMRGILVHKVNGTSISSKPNNGLYMYELPADLSAAKNMRYFLVSTVSDNAGNYTHRAYKQATEARRLQNVIMRPDTRKYRNVILDYLGDY
jgi:hypothetical protein